MRVRMMDLVGDRLPPKAGQGQEREMSPVVVAYLHAVLFTPHPRDKMGLRNSRELQTLAAIAYQLIQGHLGAGMDRVTIEHVRVSSTRDAL